MLWELNHIDTLESDYVCRTITVRQEETCFENATLFD